MKKKNGSEVAVGCISGLGCVLATVVANIVFWGALLWVLIQVLKNQGVIHS